MENNKNLFRHIPKVDEILEDTEVKEKLNSVPRKIVLNSIREELDLFREEIKNNLLNHTQQKI